MTATQFYFAAIRVHTTSQSYSTGWYFPEAGRPFPTQQECLAHTMAAHPELTTKDIAIQRFKRSDILCPTCTQHKHTTTANCHHCCGTGWL